MRKMKEAYKFMTDYTMYIPAYDTKAAQAIWENKSCNCSDFFYLRKDYGQGYNHVQLWH